MKNENYIEYFKEAIRQHAGCLGASEITRNTESRVEFLHNAQTWEEQMLTYIQEIVDRANLWVRPPLLPEESGHVMFLIPDSYPDENYYDIVYDGFFCAMNKPYRGMFNDLRTKKMYKPDEIIAWGILPELKNEDGES